MRQSIAILSAAFLVTACNGKDGDEGFSVRFSDAPSESRRDADNTRVKALYMGEFEVVAYDHRPGETVQANVDWGFAAQSGIASDWSYLIPVQAGVDILRDRLVFDAGSVDFSQIDNDSNRVGVEDAFRDAVGAFDIDYLEVMMYRTGVVYDPVGNSNASEYIYVGMNADENGLQGHPLHHYGAPLNAIEDIYTTPYFPTWQTIGWQESYFQTINVLFSDRAVFPERRVVVLQNTTANPPDPNEPYTGVRFDSLAGSQPLTATQTDILLSMANQGTHRREYQHLLIVPMDAPIRIEYDSSVAAAITTPAAQTLLSSNWQIDVKMDISGLLDTDLSTASLTTQPASATFDVDTVVANGTYTFTVNGVDYTPTTTVNVVTGADVGNEITSQLTSTSDLQFIPTATGFRVDSQYPVVANTTDANLTLTVADPSPNVTYAGDANLVPFGLQVLFTTVSADCPVATNFDEGDWCGSYSPASQPATCCVCPNGTIASYVSGAGGVTEVQCN